MEFLASLFIAKPLNILAMAALFFTGYLALRFSAPGAGRRPRPLLVPAVAWVLYALWEWLVHVLTPEANIRVDLLLIWPALAIISAWALFRSLR
jgi:hypothetical protein